MSSARLVHVIRTSTANLAAVVSAFRRLECDVILTDDPARVEGADWVVLPGVGAFGAARTAVAETGLDLALVRRIESGFPTLAICLGLQLLGTGSDETPGTPGLGVFPGVARRFVGEGLRIPQMGWNGVTPTPSCRIVPEGYAYFANSYRMDQPPEGWGVAWSEYGSHFVAAVERGAVVACQFHPELSGSYGRSLLRNWLRASRC